MESPERHGLKEKQKGGFPELEVDWSTLNARKTLFLLLPVADIWILLEGSECRSDFSLRDSVT